MHQAMILIFLCTHDAGDSSVPPIISLFMKFSKAGFNHLSDRICSHCSPIVPYLKQFFIQCSKLIMDSTSSCPLSVKLYSTLGGVSLYDFLSNTPILCSSLSLAAKVLLLNRFKVFLNLIWICV